MPGIAIWMTESYQEGPEGQLGHEMGATSGCGTQVLKEQYSG